MQILKYFLLFLKVTANFWKPVTGNVFKLSKLTRNHLRRKFQIGLVVFVKINFRSC